MSAARRWSGQAIGWILPVAAVVAAEVGARATGLSSYSLAAPSEIARAGAAALADGTLLGATWQTLIASGIGLMIGTSIGLGIGLLCGLVEAIDDVTRLSIEALRPIPSIALVPIAIMMLGLGYASEVSIIAFATIWPNLILSRAAVSQIEPRLLEVSRVLRLGFFARLWKIVVPAVIPRAFVALRIATGFAFIVALTVEIAAIPLGLGYAMMSAQQSLNPALMLAFLLWTGVLGWIINAATLWGQRALFRRMGVEREAS